MICILLVRRSDPTGIHMKIKTAEDNKIELYTEQVDQVMEVIGIDPLFISDLTLVTDFFDEEIPKDVWLKNISRELKLFPIIGKEEYLWQVAKRLSEQ